MILREIRIYADFVDATEKNRIRLMGEAISSMLLRGMGKYAIKDTNVLLIHFRADTKFKPADEFYNIGCKINGNIGSAFVFFDKKYFFDHNDDGKRKYILDRIKYAMMQYAQRFDLEKETIEKAYDYVENSNYLVKNSEVFKTKDKKYQVQLFIKVNYQSKEYWLQVTDIVNNKVELFIVCQKENFFGVEHPELTIYDLLEITQTMKILGWVDQNNFQMCWGNEEFLFNLTEKKIINSLTNKA
jgi:hypothetical protein